MMAAAENTVEGGDVSASSGADITISRCWTGRGGGDQQRQNWHRYQYVHLILPFIRTYLKCIEDNIYN